MGKTSFKPLTLEESLVRDRENDKIRWILYHMELNHETWDHAEIMWDELCSQEAQVRQEEEGGEEEYICYKELYMEYGVPCYHIQHTPDLY